MHHEGEIMNRLCILFAVGFLAVLSCGAWGAEGGSGEYLPGYFGFMAGYIPPKTGFYVGNDAYYYNAKATLVPTGTNVSVDVRANVVLDVPSFTWVTPLKIIGADVAIGIAQP